MRTVSLTAVPGSGSSLSSSGGLGSVPVTEVDGYGWYGMQ